MPLLDHFGPRWPSPCTWGSFTLHWAVGMADVLNTSLLPDDYLALTEFRNDPTGPNPDIVIDASEPTFRPRPRLGDFGPSTEPACVELFVQNSDRRPTARLLFAGPEDTRTGRRRQDFVSTAAWILRRGSRSCWSTRSATRWSCTTN